MAKRVARKGQGNGKKAKQQKAKESKPIKAAKTTKAAKAGNGGDGRSLRVNDNGASKASLSADEQRALFLHHREAWNRYIAKRKAVDEVGRDVKAALKADGYLVLHMQIADDLSGSPKREQKVRAAVQERLKVARWMGHPMGSQMDLFESQPIKQAITERAFDDGKRVGMEGGKSDPPSHFALGDLGQNWLAGWQEGQALKVKNGIKPTDPAADKGRELDAGWNNPRPPAATQASDEL